MQRPNKLLYLILNRFGRLYTILLKNHHLHNPKKIKIKTPSIIISNHTSFFDFLYVMWACKNIPVNFVVARKYCETKPLSKILKLGRCIPKSLFQPDIIAVKNILDVTKQGGVVGIFPEGQISATGITLNFPKGLGRLVKKSGVNVYALKTTGAYLMDPPWTNVHRKGRIDSELIRVLTDEEVNNLSAEKIEEILYNSIYTNPFHEKNTHLFRGKKLAKGLENLLYKCPNCNNEGYLISKNNDLICKHCNIVYRIHANGHITCPNYLFTIADAYNFQREIEKKDILQNINYLFELVVKVESIINEKYKIVSEGILHITRNYIEYISDDDYKFKINSNLVRYVPFDNGQNFQIYRDNILYQFIPNHPYLCSKAANIIEIIYEINNCK